MEAAHKLLFNVATACGSRRIVAALSCYSPYRRTIFYYPQVRGFVALTVDDGLCRHGAERSLVKPVRELLRKHGATATFFVCSNYLAGLESEAAEMVAEGCRSGARTSDQVNLLLTRSVSGQPRAR